MTRTQTRTALQWARTQWRETAASALVRNTAWQYVSNVLGAVLVFAYSLLVGRTLGVDRYGLLSLCLGFAGLVFNLVELRLHESVIRYLTEFWEKGDLPRALATVRLSLLVDVVTGLMALALVGALSPFASLMFRELADKEPISLLWLGGLVLFFGNVGNATAIGLLRVFDGFRALALVKLAGHVVKLAATAGALFLLGWNVFGVLSVAAAASLLTTLALGFAAYRQLNRRIPVWSTPAPLGLLRPRLREMRGFVLSVYGVSLAAIPTRDLDVNLLGGCSTAAVIGSYKVARDFMGAVWQVSDPLLFVLYPEFARLWTKKKFEQLRGLLRKSAAGLGVAAFALCAVAFVITPPVIELAMGTSFAAAGSYFRWMLGGVLAWMPLMWVNPLLMAAGRANLFFRATLMAGLIILALDLVLIPRWGGTGAAIAYGLGHVLAPLISLSLARRAGIFKPLRATDERRPG